MSEFQVVDTTLDEENAKEIRKEIRRLTSRFTSQKKLISKEATKDPNRLREDDQEAYLDSVKEAIQKLETPFFLFDKIYQHLTHLYTLLEELDDPDEPKEKLSKEIEKLNEEQTKYEETIYAPVHCALKKIRKDLKGALNQTTSNSENNSVNSSTQKVWKPNDCFKPTPLQIPDEVNLQQLDDWIDRLKAHLEGHHTQNIKNVNIIVGDLIHKDVKSAVNFDKKDTTPIFSEKQDGTKQENSLEERLRKYWDIRNPLSKLRSEAFGLQSTKYETFNQWKARAKQKFSKADLDNIDGPTIEGLIVLMNFNGPHADDIRQKTVEKFKEGKITINNIEQIAQEIEMVEALNGTKDQDSSQLNKLNSKNDKNNKNNKGMMHPHLKDLSKQGKCFACAIKHKKGEKCQKEKFTCNFCEKVGHTRPACTFYYDHLKGKQNKNTKAKPLTVTEGSDQSQSEETSA